LNFAIQIILISVVLLHSPIVYLQLKSQAQKLCRINEDTDFVDDSVDEVTTNFEFESKTNSLA
jgi:hypothetical protein